MTTQASIRVLAVLGLLFAAVGQANADHFYLATGSSASMSESQFLTETGFTDFISFENLEPSGNAMGTLWAWDSGAGRYLPQEGGSFGLTVPGAFDVTDSNDTGFWIFDADRHGAHAIDGSHYLFNEEYNDGSEDPLVETINFQDFGQDGMAINAFGLWTTDWADLATTADLLVSDDDGGTWYSIMGETDLPNGSEHFIGFVSTTPVTNVRLTTTLYGLNGQNGFGVDKVYFGIAGESTGGWVPAPSGVVGLLSIIVMGLVLGSRRAFRRLMNVR
jgi:hypothetical protein